MAKSKKLSAFTLIEILVALTIMGVLLTFVAPYVFDRPDQARQLKVKNDFLAISTALISKLDSNLSVMVIRAVKPRRRQYYLRSL